MKLPNQHSGIPSSYVHRSLCLLCIPCYSQGFLINPSPCRAEVKLFLNSPLPSNTAIGRSLLSSRLHAAPSQRSSASASVSASTSRDDLSYAQNVMIYRRGRTNIKTEKPEPPVAKTKRKGFDKRRTDAGAWYQREEMLQHDILTKEAETDLGNKIITAKRLRDELTSLVEQVELEAQERRESFENLQWEDDDSELLWPEDLGDARIGDDDLEYMSLYSNIAEATFEECSITNWQDSLENFNFAGDSRIASTLVKDGSKLSITALDADLRVLTDQDIIQKMGINGGKKELRDILCSGAEARTSLMRSNIRLVVSISKKWMGRSMAAGGSGSNSLYSGGWDRPSLDEVIQEGVLGLARAVDKFDPSRGLRFSTYSTHWITSYVRQTFQNASTGSLKVPAQLHEIKNSYRSLVKRYVESSEPIPSEDEVAKQLGVTLNRLRTALRATEGLLSIDEPVYNGGNAAYKGSGAGGDNSGESSLLLLDRLQCTEVAPEDFVEISFLRQSLESAMAAELSPHERDILRLRLGLDDGQTRTVRQVVEECGGGITVSDVRSAERRAFKKLRSPNALHAYNLLEYTEIAGISLR
uniref:RNA polymerase sigma-70 domain-containing protein n=1 Tax=Chaetoceros debilis TaxID=122233 RepID=A0A7S3QIQ4_9STRA|mmetsp:Transcript_29513/g.45048  ORF Transcript_29513/g.45048 Transcript_29513/m.45048 type:complete len:584 (+) Transcript_29513:143-1894(+)